MDLRDAIVTGFNEALNRGDLDPEWLASRAPEDLVTDLTPHIEAAIIAASEQGDLNISDSRALARVRRMPATDDSDYEGYVGEDDVDFSLFNVPGAPQDGDVVMHLGDVFHTPGHTGGRTETVTPVSTIDAIDFLPILAAAAHRLTPAPAAGEPFGTEMHHEDLSVANPRAFKQFVFHTQTMFGVRSRIRRTETGTVITVGGLREDVRAFRLVAETFATLGQDGFTGVDASDEAAVWSTIGHLASTTPRALSQAMEANDRYNDATDYLRGALGPARVLERVAPAADGAVHEVAVTALADAATRL